MRRMRGAPHARACIMLRCLCVCAPWISFTSACGPCADSAACSCSSLYVARPSNASRLPSDSTAGRRRSTDIFQRMCSAPCARTRGADMSARHTETVKLRKCIATTRRALLLPPHARGDARTPSVSHTKRRCTALASWMAASLYAGSPRTSDMRFSATCVCVRRPTSDECGGVRACEERKRTIHFVR
jgi:hypothetical protein